MLQQRIFVPIILLRNINPPKLYNSTQLAVKKNNKKIMGNLIEATILTGPFEGKAFLIPCIPMIPTNLPFQFKRWQFVIRLATACDMFKNHFLATRGIEPTHLRSGSIALSTTSSQGIMNNNSSVTLLIYLNQ